MPKVTFILKDGSRRDIAAAEGQSLLEIAQANGLDIEGACDGSMACSTCHVIVDQAWYDRLPEPGEEETDMLDFAFDATLTSRLGCQILVTGDLDGLVVALPATTHNFLVG